MKSLWHLRLLNAAAWINLLAAAVLIAAALSFGPTWPVNLAALVSGDIHGR
jgi:uncharacterized membrane protein